MKPTKQIVYLPTQETGENDLLVINTQSNLKHSEIIIREGYFFTPEQLNEYTKTVGKAFLESGAEKVKDEIACDSESTEHYYLSIKPSITNTLEETFKKFEV